MRTGIGLLIAAAIAFSPAQSNAQRSYSGDRYRSASYDSITRTINECEDRTDGFRSTLRRALNNSPFDRGDREEHLLRQADRLENALDRTGDSWNRDRDPRKTRRYVNEALDAARSIDAAMRRWRFDHYTEREWSVVRSQLNYLARALEPGGGRW